MKKTYVLGLCKDRHPTPVRDGVFPEVVLGTHNPDYIYEQAKARIPEDCGRLALYVTGLTVAIMAVVRVCNERKIDLTCYQWDRVTGYYKRQDVLKY